MVASPGPFVSCIIDNVIVVNLSGLARSLVPTGQNLNNCFVQVCKTKFVC